MIRIKHTRWANHGWAVKTGGWQHTMCYDEFRRFFIVGRSAKEIYIVISKSDNSGGHAHRVRMNNVFSSPWVQYWDEKMKWWDNLPLTSMSLSFFKRQIEMTGADPYAVYYVWVEVD